MKELFDIICSTSKYDYDMYTDFEVVYYAVIYINPKVKFKLEK